MPQDATCLTNHFLIAMPGMEDGFFSHSVSYVCEHNANGAIAIMINRPLAIKLGEIFTQMGIANQDATLAAQPIVCGGPVQPERGFVIHPNKHDWHSTLHLPNDISITTSQDILHAMAKHEGPEHALISLGYAGWGPGQLEEELLRNYWLTSPATADILFQQPFAERWSAATRSLGIEPSRLSTHVGHA